MTHRESLDCACRPVIRDQVGGGRVYVHQRAPEGRIAEPMYAPDRLCPSCGRWHLLGHPHLR